MRLWPASPSSPTRTISTAASRFRTSITPWRRACAKTFRKLLPQQPRQGARGARRGRQRCGGCKRADRARRAGDRRNGPASPATTAMTRRWRKALFARVSDDKTRRKVHEHSRASTPTRRRDQGTYQAMEALVHNLNTMHSRAGAQIPFSSHQLRYGYLA